MESMSVVTVNGSMFFIKNNIPDDIIKKIDSIAKEMQLCVSLNDNTNDTEMFYEFSQRVSQQLNIDLEKIFISHVYRINV